MDELRHGTEEPGGTTSWEGLERRSPESADQLHEDAAVAPADGGHTEPEHRAAHAQHPEPVHEPYAQTPVLPRPEHAGLEPAPEPTTADQLREDSAAAHAEGGPTEPEHRAAHAQHPEPVHEPYAQTPVLPRPEHAGLEPAPEPTTAEAEADSVEAAHPAPALPAEEGSPPARRRVFGRARDNQKSEKKPRKERASAKDKRVKKIVGLKIGASQIAAARVHNNGAPELVDVFREPLEPGLVVAGEIRDPESLAGAIERFFDRHKLPKKGVRLGLSNNRIGVRVFEIEGVTDAKQLENAIRFRAEEVLPIPLDEAVLDYVVLEEGERENGIPVQRILLVVAYREVVDRYLDACHRAGLEVVGIDLEAFALLRSLAAPTDQIAGGGALVAVAVGHDRTTIAVSNGRLCEFTRVLDWGGWSLNVAVARELDRAPSEVEAVKRQLSFAEETHVDGLSHEEIVKAREAVQRALSAFARELVASLHFYQAQPGALGIGEIVVTGGTAHMSGFPDALGAIVGVPVRLGDPFSRVRVSSGVDADPQAGSLAVAIGLGIED